MLARLFPEILSYIMILAQESIDSCILDTNEDDSISDEFHQLPFEIAISHVSSTLRSIALTTGRLWSTIHVDSGAQDVRVVLERVKVYLKRSGGHSLDLRIELNDARSQNNTLLKKTFDAVAKESGRWRKLVIVAEREGITDVITGVRDRLVQGEKGNLTPALEFLSISVDYTEEGFANIHSVGDLGAGVGIRPSQGHYPPRYNDTHDSSAFRRTTLGRSPNLAFLRLRGLALYLFQPTMLPCLQTLHLDQTKSIPLSFDFFSDFISACPALEHLSIYGDIIMPSGHGALGASSVDVRQEPLPVLEGGELQSLNHSTGYAGRRGVEVGDKVKDALDSMICLPELRSLRICDATGSVLRVILSKLEAPKLQSLSVKDVQEHDFDTLWEPRSSFPPTPGTSGDDHKEKQASYSLTSKFTQIRSLTLNNSDLSQFVYQRLFHAFPRIVDFASYLSMEVDDAPRLLNDGAVGFPWPSLRTLTFIFDVDLYADDEALEELVRHRREFGYPIERLRVGVDEVDLGDVLEAGADTTVIVLVKMDGIDEWPSGQRYRDVDDVLF
ncbi:hypothetical protein NP233_g10323 [Leucocoprinus birnbaumii]|uniref:F-box domain-containing protein n=1 Tax=Leucocoprinus birnbaumii TaxID=56174 RepID=A0AAD5VIS2_9AGAR|nr:hypothetical protein NP233_g10323 [Leucocoprinus birnbaumii]